MSQIIQTPASRQDLDDIWDYIGRDSEKRATEFIRRIKEVLSLIADNPEMGRTRDELEKGLRSFPVGKYTVFYRSIQDEIQVIRVLHGSMDIPDIFE